MPAPLRIVPSKLNTRFVTWGAMKFSELNRLNTSKSSSSRR